ncbi:MAG: hypothetical protein AAGF84_07240 [Planctomycetota bacterium]
MTDPRPLCDQCGQRPGVRHKWMVRRLLATLPDSPVRCELFCERCYRWQRVYSIIGMTLLLTVLGTVLFAIVLVGFLFRA